MATNLKVKAQPYEFEFEPTSTALLVIDMQRDFILPGGFGEMLGNDVSRLTPAIEPTRRVLETFRSKHLAASPRNLGSIIRLRFVRKPSRRDRWLSSTQGRDAERWVTALLDYPEQSL